MRRAVRDTYAMEWGADGVGVRRRCVAGQLIPDAFDLEDDSAAVDEGIATHAAGYAPHQRAGNEVEAVDVGGGVTVRRKAPATKGEDDVARLNREEGERAAAAAKAKPAPESS